jgi:hypothetical protein
MKTKTLPGFDTTGGRALMVMHTFEVTRDGQLSHSTDGTLRAIVPPEGWADYCKQYPEAQDIVDELTKPVEVAPAGPSVQEQLAAALAKVQELQAAQPAAVTQ